ncbi:hypothetical protein [Ruminococcus sp.]|uniref:hypothetical protein n=1 Tax=Ruminococcus sp. TaxID=41978 RepID=UPI00258D913B|nr:hypothetical protein [Ruminococcus sp.]MCR5021888.1 hypothetical protein [Ruminococcus sp.]
MEEKFIPYEKMSAKERRKIDNKRRGTWGGMVPVTRTVPSGKTYTRKIKHKNSAFDQ